MIALAVLPFGFWWQRFADVWPAARVRAGLARAKGRGQTPRAASDSPCAGKTNPRGSDPLAQSMAASALGIADPIVKKLISPEALSELLAVGWPVAAVSDPPPPGTLGITRSTMGTIWQIFGNSEYGFGRFEVTGPAALPAQQRFRLTLRLLQWRWRLVGVTLPENIQNLLADELIKATRR